MSPLFKRIIFILVHLLCWGAFAVAVLYNHPQFVVTMPEAFWIRQTILLCTLILVFYLNYYLLIPRLLLRKKVWQYILLCLLLVVAVSFIVSAFTYTQPHLADHVRPRPFWHRRPEHYYHMNLFVPGLHIMLIILGIAISFVQKWQQLEKEKITTELSLLKAQINPHFFFNTLNTIYSYTLSDGDTARTAITDLSKMMRYVLYDAANSQTTLDKEAGFIRDYIELMKLRTGPRTKIDVSIPDNLPAYPMAPMLFLPYVENAFKYGVSGIADGYIRVMINFGDTIELTVTNTVYANPRASEDNSNGIGLVNTSRRLELLYPGKHTLKTGMISGTEYQASLILFL